MPLFSITKANKFGFIDQDGKEVISPKFEKVFDFEEGLAWASVLEKGRLVAGFINESGDWAVEPNFSSLGWSDLEPLYFSEGIAPIQSKNGKMLFVNTKGEPITEPIYDHAYAFSEGRALVAREGKYGFVDHTGSEVIPCQFGKFPLVSSNCRFSEGLAMVRFGDAEDFGDPPNLGYIDKEGNTVFEPQFTNAYPFSEGFTMIRLPGHFGEYDIMNTEGETPIDKTAWAVASFSQGLLEIHDKDTERLGFIDQVGAWVVGPRYAETFRFTQDRAAVKSKPNGKWGYIDKNDDQIIDEKFDMVTVFKNGLAAVEEQKRLGYIDLSGEYVWQV